MKAVCMVRRAIIILAAACIAAAAGGCLEMARPASNAQPQLPPPGLQLPMLQPASQPDDGPPADLANPIALRVLCDLLIVEVPEGTISANKPLWQHLREDAVGVELADHMARNGFRLGIGKAGGFAEVTRMMREGRDKKERTGRLRFQSEAAMEVMINSELRPARAFVYDAGGAMSGDDYPAGVTLFWVQAWHDVEELDAVNLTVVPEIRYGKVRERYYTPTLKRADQYRDIGRLFDEVKLNLRLHRGEFLVLSPNRKSEPATVLGRALLSQTDKGQTHETVLLIRPRVERVPNP